MNRAQHGRAMPRDGGLQPMNAANEDAALDTLLHQYFRLALPTSGASKKRLKRPRTDADTEPTTTPDAALKRIKAFLKASKDDKHIQRVIDALSHQLDKAKRQPLILPFAVRLATELFSRSAAFRGLIGTQAAAFYTKFLEAAGEKDVGTKRPRLSPSEQSRGVRMVLAMIEDWVDAFGARYPTIVAGHAWLSELGYEFPRVKETTANAERDEVQRRQHQASVRQLQVKKMEQEMATTVPEMETTMLEMDSIFKILVPTLEAFELEEKEVVEESATPTESSTLATTKMTADVDEDEDVEWEDVQDVARVVEQDDEHDSIEWEDVGDGEDDGAEVDDVEDMDINEIVQAYGLGSSSYQLTIEIPTTVCEQSAENEVLFRSLADGVLQIRKRFLPLVHNWIQIADGDAVALDQPRDAALVRTLHSLRQRLDDATLKWEDLVKESDRKRFARIRPRVVTLPLADFDGDATSRHTRRKVRP